MTFYESVTLSIIELLLKIALYEENKAKILIFANTDFKINMKSILNLIPVFYCQVTIEHNTTDTQINQKPVIIIDAGMEGGSDSTNFGLYIIEQLTACKEYEEMIEKAKWVILPCVNPDGVEYNAYVSIFN